MTRTQKHELRSNSPWTVSVADASALPTMFSATQVYEPTSAVDRRRIFRVWSSRISYLGAKRAVKDLRSRRPQTSLEDTAKGQAYLPLGRSPSSFLQRTVGTGSPRASHLNSTLWSTSTTWLTGRCTKLGRSASVERTKQCNFICFF